MEKLLSSAEENVKGEKNPGNTEASFIWRTIAGTI
jgi:hypothetical protein